MSYFPDEYFNNLALILTLEKLYFLQVKCEMYWPENTNEPKQYGDLVVETVSNSTVNFYDFRIFKIKLVR